MVKRFFRTHGCELSGVGVSGLVLIGLLALAGCQHQTTQDLGSGAQDSSPVRPVSQDPDLAVENPSTALKTMIESRVTCETPADCASGVGMLLASADDGVTVNRCSGFLIAPDVLATSLRCLPPDLRDSGDDCGGRVRVVFPFQGADSKNVGCDRVLSVASASPSNLLEQQYAFLKLRTSVFHEFYHLSHDGMTDRSLNYSLTAVDPSQDPPAIRSFSCPAVLSSALLLGQGTVNSPVVPVGCIAPREALGGMLAGLSRNSRGIWYGPVSKEVIRAVQNVFSRHSSQTRLSWTGNLACIQTPIDPTQFYFSADCDLSIDSSQLGPVLSGLKSGIVAQFAGEARTELERWAQSNHEIFQQWQLGTDPSGPGTELFPAPLCFSRSDSSGWLKNYRNWVGIYDSSATVKLSLPVWSVNLVLDDHLAITGYVTREGQSDAQLSFSPSEFHSSGQSKVDVNLKSPKSASALTQSIGTVSTCP